MITEFYHGLLMTHSETPNTNTSDYENSISVVIYHLGQSHFKFHNKPKYSLLRLRAILKWKCIFFLYTVWP